MRSTDCTFTEQTMGRVRRRTSTKQRSMDVGGAQLAPEMFWKREEGQQFGQIALQLLDHGGILASPTTAEGSRRSLCLAAALGQIDSLCIGLDGIVVALADLLQNVAHLVYPAALMRGAGIDGLNGRGQAGASIGDDQQQLVAFQTAPVEIVQRCRPVGLFSLFG